MAWSARFDSIEPNGGASFRAAIEVTNWESPAFYVRLQRSTNGMSGWATNGMSGWATVASKRFAKNTAAILGNVILTDSGIPAGGRYFYRIRITGNNETRFTGSASTERYTTPKTPTGVKVRRVSPTQAEVSVTGSLGYANSWEVLAGGVSKGVFTSPQMTVSLSSTEAHSVTVRARRTSSTGVVSAGAWSGQSEAVTLELPSSPAAPVVDVPGVAGSAVTVSWRHATRDSSHQSRWEVRRRIVGGSWTTSSDSNDDSSTSFSGLAVGEYEVQVRTAGASLVYGAWSDSVLVRVVSPPTVTITSPPSAPNNAIVEAAWTTVQAEGFPQSSWKATLSGPDGVIESIAGSGGQSAVTFTDRVKHGVSYTVNVDVWCSGVKGTASKSFTPSLTTPNLPIVSTVWDDLAGCMNVSVTPAAGGVPSVRLTLDRRAADGSWVPAASGASSISFTDFEALSNGVTEYRATAWSADDAPADRVVDAMAESDAIWLGAGEGFAHTARVRFDPEYGIDGGRERATVTAAGRSLPVAYAGEQKSRSVSVSGLILEDEQDDTSVDEFIEVGQSESPVHLLRDPQGRRIYGSLGEVSTSRDRDLGAWSISFDLTETSR